MKKKKRAKKRITPTGYYDISLVASTTQNVTQPGEIIWIKNDEELSAWSGLITRLKSLFSAK